MAIPAGTRIGDYEVVGAVGAGGMGEVYRARDVSLGREVALKFLPAEFTADVSWRRRFEREARLLASLNHPNLATVHRFDADATPPFLVMELVPGETLAARLARGPTPIGEAIDVLRQIAAGLEAAHEAGIIHRDLKPANIKITPDAAVKILDFGLAKSVRDDSSDPDIQQTVTAPYTLEGVVMGTAPYMSPEQARGKPVDRRADLWALGCVGYEMLCGRRAFPGEGATDTIAAVLRGEPDWNLLPRETTARLIDLLKRCLQKDPSRRLRDARDLRLALEDLQAEASSVRSAGGTPATRAPAAPRAGLSWLAWSTALIATVAAVGFWWTGRRPAPAIHAVHQFTQLTDQVGEEDAPSISPDGKSIAYAGRSRGSWDIYVQRVGGHNPIVIAGETGVDERSPAFSPDGTQIAFHRTSGGIFVVGATGESVRRLTDFGFQPAWSADGRRIAFCTEEIAGASSRFTKSSLWVVDVAGGAPKKVFDGDGVQPSWSPSGARLVFWAVDNKGQRDLYDLPADGGTPVRLTDDAALDWSPTWSPDGASIFFASDRSGPMNIWRLPIDQASGEPRGAPEAVTNGVVAAADQPSLSKDGAQLVFRSRTISANPSAIPFDPVSERIGDPKLLLQRTGILGPSDVSRDGQWVVLRNQGEAQEDIFICRIDGTELRRLTDDMFRDRAPVFSPDGSRLAFYSNRSPAGVQVWTIKADGSGLTQVSNDPTVELNFPFYSPSGDRIVASALRERRVFVFDLSKPLPIANAEEWHGFEVPDGWLVPNRWSPDGRLIVGQIVVGTGGGSAIGVYDVSTHTARKISDDRLGAQWLPDSRRLIAIGQRNAIVIIDVVTGQRRVLPAPQLSGLDLAGLSATADGRTLIVGVRRSEADIWMATLR